MKIERGGAGQVATFNRIAVVDAQVLSRECLAHVLTQERGVTVESYSSLQAWASSNPKHTSLIVLCQYGMSKTEALSQVERLAQLSAQTGSCPAVILSDNEDPDLIVAMLGKSVRGYVPPSSSVNHAID